MAVPQAPAQTGASAAFGLYVAGAGATVTRAQAVAAIERGSTRNSFLGGSPRGRRKIRLSFSPPAQRAGPAIYLVLPPPGRHTNERRYELVVVGLGNGILTSSSTRIPGLVAVTDIAEEARALAEHRDGPMGVTSGSRADLPPLDRRLHRAYDTRTGSLTFAILLLAAAGAAAYLLRSRLLARAAVVLGAAAVVASLIVSGAGAERTTPVVLAFALVTLALSAAGAFLPRAPLVAAALLAVLVVLAVDTSVNSFGPLGPHPETGTRFYGLSNLETTLLLAPILGAAATGWFLPVAALALVAVGWSHAGADGGGLLVVGVGLGVLWLRLRAVPLTVRRVALVAAGAVLLGLALVGVDAALGGSSHVTHAVGSGSVFEDIWNRWHLSWRVATSSWYKIVLLLAGIVGFVWLATRRPRMPTVDAALAATIVSLVVNDTPVDVLGVGAFGALTLLAWERTRASVDSRPMRRPLLALPLLVLVLAGCGSKGTVQALPETVVGTVQQEAPGKAIFAAQGCNGCHTYQPAGSSATVGPDLDKLADYAKKAKQPLASFVHESIVKPGAYVEKGYPNVMPKQYGSLPKNDIDALVAFLTKPQGG